MSQLPVCLYLENSFKQENNELNELSECMLYKMLAFLKISQNCNPCLLYNKSSKTFHDMFACFVLKLSKTFHNMLAYFALKVSKTFHNMLAFFCCKSF